MTIRIMLSVDNLKDVALGNKVIKNYITDLELMQNKNNKKETNWTNLC